MIEVCGYNYEISFYVFNFLVNPRREAELDPLSAISKFIDFRPSGAVLLRLSRILRQDEQPGRRLVSFTYATPDLRDS